MCRDRFGLNPSRLPERRAGGRIAPARWTRSVSICEDLDMGAQLTGTVVLLFLLTTGCGDESGPASEVVAGDAGEIGADSTPGTDADAAAGTADPDRDDIIAEAGGDGCAEYAYARCMFVNACLEPRSMRRCAPAIAADCRARAAIPDSGWNDAALLACVEALQRDWCGAPFECMFASPGARADGSSCQFNAQCSSGNCAGWRTIECATDAAATTTCSPECGSCAPRIGLDGDCGMNSAGCEVGLVCAQAGEYDYRCIQPKPQGASCQTDAECTRPLECSLLEHRCVPRSGSNCFDEQDCPPLLYCAPGGCAIPTTAGLGKNAMKTPIRRFSVTRATALANPASACRPLALAKRAKPTDRTATRSPTATTARAERSCTRLANEPVLRR